MKMYIYIYIYISKTILIMNPACDPKQRFLNHLGCGTWLKKHFLIILSSRFSNHVIGIMTVEALLWNPGYQILAVDTWL